MIEEASWYNSTTNGQMLSRNFTITQGADTEQNSIDIDSIYIAVCAQVCAFHKHVGQAFLFSGHCTSIIRHVAVAISVTKVH